MLAPDFDGHSGVLVEKLEAWHNGQFRFALTVVHDKHGNNHFVFHAGMQLGNDFDRVLSSMGFKHSHGKCNVIGRGCHWHRVGSSFADRGLAQNTLPATIEGVKQALSIFKQHFPKIWSKRENENNILRSLNMELGPNPVFRAPLEIDDSQYEEPEWISSILLDRLQELYGKRDELEREIVDLERFLPLVFATGSQLENAVLHAVEFLGYSANKTEPGANVDIMAKGTDGKELGIEVTGIKGPVKKDSRKIAQMLQFHQEESEDGKKPVLLANTHLETPVLERTEPAFSDWTSKTATKLDILLMTGWDLYRLVREVYEGRLTKEHATKLLATETGTLDLSVHGLTGESRSDENPE